MEPDRVGVQATTRMQNSQRVNGVIAHRRTEGFNMWLTEKTRQPIGTQNASTIASAV
jgi:phosphopantothenate synthetase